MWVICEFFPCKICISLINVISVSSNTHIFGLHVCEVGIMENKRLISCTNTVRSLQTENLVEGHEKQMNFQLDREKEKLINHLPFLSSRIRDTIPSVCSVRCVDIKSTNIHIYVCTTWHRKEVDVMPSCARVSSTLSVPRQAGVDQTRIFLHQLLGTEAQLLHHACAVRRKSIYNTIYNHIHQKHRSYFFIRVCLCWLHIQCAATALI